MAKARVWARDKIVIETQTINVTYVFVPSSLYGGREFKESDLEIEWRNFLDFILKEKTEVQQIMDPQVYNELKKHTPKLKARLNLYPDFNYFKKITRYVLEESLKIFLGQTPEVVRGNSLSIQIKIVKAGRFPNLLPKFDGALIGTLCTFDQAFLEISGEYLMDRVVGPLFMLKLLKQKENVDLPTIIFHELQHQIGLKSVQFYDRVFDKNWRKIYSKASKRYPKVRRRSGGAIMLIATVYGIETEALSMFRENRNVKEIPIVPKYAQEFREKLEKLAKIIAAKDAKIYFEKEVDIDWESGTYYCSLAMPLTIALAIAKKEDKWDIFLRNKKNEQYHFTKFSNLLMKGQDFYVPKLPDALFKKTMQYIYEKTYVWSDKKGHARIGEAGVHMSPVLRFKRLILLYEEACATLEIRKQDRVITWSYFYDLYRRARIYYKKKYKEMVEEAGFVYEDLETAYY